MLFCFIYILFELSRAVDIENDFGVLKQDLKNQKFSQKEKKISKISCFKNFIHSVTNLDIVFFGLVLILIVLLIMILPPTILCFCCRWQW
ncbi:hypothetical protein AAJ76_1030008540 [Vairimorpha ceranae]|uniref:Uncharacterized protein n=1 Tax=Vairimorpha ceranae TaxID=40302 RepID=A0A0F9WBC4_9MICR|nr:hypothetical protein AAJ76_1030008540 [Vairimorpha ceranae]KKO74195.1 hypothetical protein AAJ76_1030008540 [Vairimorpha ceranae]